MARHQRSPAAGDAGTGSRSHDGAVTLASEPEIAHSPQWSPELNNLRRQLHQEFAELPEDTVDHCLATEVIRFDGCRITSFVPILIEKNVRARLRAIRATRARMVVVPPPE